MLENQNFGIALKALKAGCKVARKGWNGKDMWLILCSQSQFISIQDKRHEYIDMDKELYDLLTEDGDINGIGILGYNGSFCQISDFILMKTADNKCVPWLASQTDLLADDWSIIN